MFSQVLATGLSGLYSSLPTKIEAPTEDWHCLSKDDLLQMPSLVQFLNSLEFCNAVIQVSACRAAPSERLRRPGAFSSSDVPRWPTPTSDTSCSATSTTASWCRSSRRLSTRSVPLLPLRVFWPRLSR